MKPELQAKFLQHMNKKKKDGGFTLIELLVVIIIIGILAAIALPSLLSQANKAKQSEGRNNIGAINRAQQARYLEAAAFAQDDGTVVATTVLGIGIPTQTTNYVYTSKGTAISVNAATPAIDNLKAYAGIAFIATIGSQSASQAVACESLGTVAPGSANTPTEATAFDIAKSDCLGTGTPGFKNLGSSK